MALMTRGDTDNPPHWLVCKKSLIPDMVAKSPDQMPVWEITGAEFTKSDHHTADGISIRFPRITKQRDDKSYKEATNLHELNVLFQASKDCMNLHMLTDGLNEVGSGDEIEIKTKIQHKQVKSPSSSAGAAMKRKQKSTSDDEEPLNSKVKVKQLPLNNETDVKFNETDEDRKNTASTSSAASKKAKIETNNKKQKLKYIFDDSSEDEEAATSSSAVAANRKPKMPATTKSNNESLATSSMNVQIEKKLLSSAASANDCDIENKSTKETADAGTIAKNSDINIFEGVLLYVPSELRDCVKEELRYFVLWGGTESNSSKKSTHVLHKNDSLSGDWSYLR